MTLKINFIAFLLIISSISFGQEEYLQSGPMVGYSGFREVLIWVQTTSEAEVKIKYKAHDNSERFTSQTVRANKTNDYIAKIRPDSVEYGKTYSYKLFINDVYVPRNYPLQFQTQSLWQWRTDPPDFSFAIGSCFYANEPKDDRPGKPYGGGYQIFNSILEKKPDFMVWLGDNVYLREPDFLTERGIRHRYRNVRATPELQPLLGSVHNYAIWDDHDYGPNNSDGSYANKDISEKVFNDYWGNLNTNVVKTGGITSHFAWNDVEFFMMDNRYHRDSNRKQETHKSYLGEEQIEWLINALATSQASFKVVCIGGQTISDAAVKENYATYPEERLKLLDRLHNNKIEGVIFLSGDRHHTEISRFERPNAYPLIDITCSPLTSGVHKPINERNTNLVKDKTYYERNFGLIKIAGPSSNRSFLLTIFNSDGQKIWDYSVEANELRYTPVESKN